MDELRDILSRVDTEIWLLAGLCVVTVLTLQAVDAAVDGAWPHQHRSIRIGPGGRNAHRGWGVAAALLLPGLLLGIANLAIIAWRDADRGDAHLLGSILVGAGWLLFIFGTSARLPIGRYIRQAGVAGPLALIAVLIAGDALLLIGLLDILPPLDEIREALPIIGSED